MNIFSSFNLYNHHLQNHPHLGHQSFSSSLDSHRHKHMMTHIQTHRGTNTPPALNQPPAQPTSFCNKGLLLTVSFSVGQSDTSHRLLSDCSSSLASSPPHSAPCVTLCPLRPLAMGAHDQKMKQGSPQAENESKHVCVCLGKREREGERLTCRI